MKQILTGSFRGTHRSIQVECYPKTAEIKVLLLSTCHEPIVITQNLGQSLPPYQAFLAENMLDLCDNGFMSFMEENNLGYIADYKHYDANVFTGQPRRIAAIFQFDRSVLKQLDPMGCARYERHYFQQKRRLERHRAVNMACAAQL